MATVGTHRSDFICANTVAVHGTDNLSIQQTESVYVAIRSVYIPTRIGKDIPMSGVIKHVFSQLKIKLKLAGIWQHPVAAIVDCNVPSS